MRFDKISNIAFLNDLDISKSFEEYIKTFDLIALNSIYVIDDRKTRFSDKNVLSSL